MTTNGDAAYQIENGVCTMRFERRFAQPIERVWAALTEPDELKAWFYEFIGALVPGETVVIPWEEEGGLTSRIVEFTPMTTFAWTWQKPGDPESIVRWELSSQDGGTLFVLTHSLPVLGPNEPTDTLAGWQEHLDTLGDYLGGRPRAWSHESWRALKDRYAFEIEKARVPGDDGIVEVINGKPQLHFARILDAPLARVWEACSTAEGISAWFVDAEIDAREGGAVTLDFGRFNHGTFAYDIVKFEPPRVIEFLFGDTPEDVVRWELFDGGDQTLFVLTNRLGPAAEAGGQLGGWHYHLDRLPTALSGLPDDRPDDLIPSLNAHYGNIVA